MRDKRCAVVKGDAFFNLINKIDVTQSLYDVRH